MVRKGPNGVPRIRVLIGMNGTRYKEKDGEGDGGTFVWGIEPQTTFLCLMLDGCTLKISKMHLEQLTIRAWLKHGWLQNKGRLLQVHRV